MCVHHIYLTPACLGVIHFCTDEKKTQGVVSDWFLCMKARCKFRNTISTNQKQTELNPLYTIYLIPLIVALPQERCYLFRAGLPCTVKI